MLTTTVVTDQSQAPMAAFAKLDGYVLIRSLIITIQPGGAMLTTTLQGIIQQACAPIHGEAIQTAEAGTAATLTPEGRVHPLILLVLVPVGPLAVAVEVRAVAAEVIRGEETNSQTNMV